MSKTKELLIVCFFIALGGFATWNVAHSQESPLKCYPNAEFMKMIDDRGLVTLYNGTKGNKTNEVMLSKDRHAYVVEYDKASDGNAMVAKQYCVTSVFKDATFNEKAVDFLSNLLEKSKGQKT